MAGSTTTNSDLAVMIGTVIGEMTGMKQALFDLNKTLMGNGHPGLIEDHRCLDAIVKAHIEEEQSARMAREDLARETKEARELLAAEVKKAKDMLATDEKARREKLSGRWWAIIMACIAFVITNVGGLIVLFIRTGGWK